MMIEFWIIASVMMAVAVLLIVVPIWRGLRRPGPEDREVSVHLYRQRMAELQQDVDSGVMPAEDLDEARTELDRQLLDETGAAGSDGGGARAARRRGRWATLAVVVLVPLIGVGLYSRLGGKPWDSHQPPPLSRSQVVQMVHGLAQRLQNNPDDGQGWLMLGRSYLVMGRYREAVKALTHAREVLGDTPETLTDYAEALAMSSGSGSLSGQPEKLLNKALSLDGSFPKALWLAGIGAAQQGDYRTAIAHWRKLLSEQKTGGKGAKLLQQAIAKARKRMAAADGAPASGPVRTSPVAGASASIRVRVALAPSLAAKANPDDLVFIYARPVSGSPMPVAVVRRKVKDLPTSVVLNDRGAMMPGHALSDYSKVAVAARVSVHGGATAHSGDLEASSRTVPVDGGHVVRLVIDHVLHSTGSR